MAKKGKKERSKYNSDKNAQTRIHQRDSESVREGDGLSSKQRPEWPDWRYVGFMVLTAVSAFYWDRGGQVPAPLAPTSASLSTLPCEYVMAKSTIQGGGLGVFSLVERSARQKIMVGGVVIQVPDLIQKHYPGIAFMLDDYVSFEVHLNRLPNAYEFLH